MFVPKSDHICSSVHFKTDSWLNYEWDIGLEFTKGKFWTSVSWLQQRQVLLVFGLLVSKVGQEY